jgi:hypothetical protein
MQVGSAIASAFIADITCTELMQASAILSSSAGADSSVSPL